MTTSSSAHTAGNPDPWLPSRSPDAGGPDFGRLMEQVRHLQDAVAGAAPPPEVVAAAADQITAIARLLDAHHVDEADQIVGRRYDLIGRGQALTPPIRVVESDASHTVGHLNLGRFYLGANGAAHGGVIPLIFDEVLGRLSDAGGRPRSRTAYLHVNFRHITPIGADLVVESTLDREEGRKRFITGVLRHGDTVVADAEGLFVVLKEGQQ
jgi:acyl-coenzyme A thioesterase PaaI-like protein